MERTFKIEVPDGLDPQVLSGLEAKVANAQKSIDREVAKAEKVRIQKLIQKHAEAFAEKVASEGIEASGKTFSISVGEQGLISVTVRTQATGQKGNGKAVEVEIDGEWQRFDTSRAACESLGLTPDRWGAANTLRGKGYPYRWVAPEEVGD